MSWQVRQIYNDKKLLASNLPVFAPAEITCFSRGNAVWLHEKPQEFYIQTIKAGLRRARKARGHHKNEPAPRNLAVVIGYSHTVVAACWALGYKTVIALTDGYWNAERDTAGVLVKQVFDNISKSKLKETVRFAAD